jgi:uncharacterized Tic20 family protein
VSSRPEPEERDRPRRAITDRLDREDAFAQEEDRPEGEAGRRRRRRAGTRSTGELTEEEKSAAMVFWVMALVLSPIGPIVWWIVKKEVPFVAHQGRQWVNHAITSLLVLTVFLAIVLVALALGFFVRPAAGIVVGALGVLLLFAWGAASFVFTILALIKTMNGEWYRIPFTLHVLK